MRHSNKLLIAFFCVALISASGFAFAASTAWFGVSLPISARLYGLRDAVYFSLLYFVGRATPDVVRDERVLKALFFVGLITSGVAVLERLFVTPAMLVLLGTAEYFQDFLGVALFTAGNPYGLPINYSVMIGDHLVQRAGSTYLSSQGFAIPFLIIVPAATAWLLAKRRGAAAWLGYAVLWLGLFLSITRMTIVTCLLQALVVAATRRRWGLIVGVGATCLVAFGGAMLVVPELATYVGETLMRVAGGSWIWDGDSGRAVAGPDSNLGLAPANPRKLLATAVGRRDGEQFDTFHETWSGAVEELTMAQPSWRPVKVPTPGLDPVARTDDTRLASWLAERSAGFAAISTCGSSAVLACVFRMWDTVNAVASTASSTTNWQRLTSSCVSRSCDVLNQMVSGANGSNQRCTRCFVPLVVASTAH